MLPPQPVNYVVILTIPQQSSTVSVLQTRPSSSSGTFTSSSQSQPQSSRGSGMSWNTYNPAASSGSYRVGHPVVAPYAFTSTPNLSSPTNPPNRQSLSPHLRPEHRTSSAPQVSLNHPYTGVNSRHVHNLAAGSVSTSSSNSSVQSYVSKDDTAIPSRQLRSEPVLRPLSTANLPSPPSSFMNISSPTPARPSPDRYRRGSRRPDSVAGTLPTPTMASGSRPLPTDDRSQSGSPGPAQDLSRNTGHHRVASADETSRVEKSHPELAKRYRRRSWGTIDNAGLINMQLHLPASSPVPTIGGNDYFDQHPRPRSAQSHRESPGSLHSAHSSTSSVRDTAHMDLAPSSNKGPTKVDEAKRSPKPSPLSQPVAADPSPPSPQVEQSDRKANPVPNESIASQRLADISKNDVRRPGKSRLRRAFSFGSASELLKASAQTNAGRKDAILAEKARREMLQEELGAEHAAIAEQQEASGLGESIYSHHQGRFFNASTDNISISSTASSASIMLRKMGKGMKKSTRSLVGLFRPKADLSTTPTDGMAVEPMTPQLSVINVEADRKSVSVNADPQDLPRGGTMFPKVEIKTADTAGQEDVALDKSQSRKSIVGGDRERAEVLAAVRKGILKKTYSDPVHPTSSRKPSDTLQTASGNDSPHSSAPSTPEDQNRSGIRRSEVRIAGEDDYLAEGRLAGGESKSAPISPQAMLPKSLVFSPRIQFHETWPSGEYDRRGEVATCNRLTPLLAQQIKEELNNFKMEMEVHETSKIYTHFL
ncbi:bud neck involved protein [Aspergillus nanangensis]|uniref:Bud neck involved protein n=1 Tax=Aspergillus nanangensis TaxID=2582783 RepID=A0AAD4GSB5_ASPNN|nr:bud neck involved protein [Aspergillus nanangensis]